MASQPRAWQEDALRKFNATTNDFLLVACPGAGKTPFAAMAIASEIGRKFDFVIVVVPTDHLRGQWCENVHKFAGIDLDPGFRNADTVVAPDYHGVVTTYQSVASQPELWRRMCSKHRTLVVFDEIHHASEVEHRSWGPALLRAFESAVRRLLLSGTPYRTDGAQIPFASYNEDGYYVPNHRYGYAEGIADRVVRPIECPILDGSMRWQVADLAVEVRLSRVPDDEMAAALSVALDPDGSWIPGVLRRADQDLSIKRQVTPDAAGLVVAADQATARRYGQILEAITGEPAAVAISDNPHASKVIKSFRDGTARWLVAVAMVSEGVDIPRLSLGVYATRTRTRIFFQQLVGRFVRVRPGDEASFATLFIPEIAPLVKFAREIEEEVREAIREQLEGGKGDEPRIDTERREFLILGSSEPEHTSTVLRGEQPTQEELRRAQELIQQHGSRTMSAAELAIILRSAGMAPVVGHASMDVPVVREDTLIIQKKRLAAKVNSLVGQLIHARHDGDQTQYKVIHYEMNKAFGDKLRTATVETLRGRIELLMDWLR